VLPEENRVVVQGVNIVKRHVKDSVNQVTGQQVKGGIISSEAPIHVSNVQLLVRDAEGNEVLTRVGRSRTEATKRRGDGSEYSGTRGVRVARKTGEEIR
jgi:large subunit ribosomal protein L24